MAAQDTVHMAPRESRYVSGVPCQAVAEVEGLLLLHDYRCVLPSGCAVYEHWGMVNSVLIAELEDRRDRK
jgi:hypothetical protein